MKVSVIIPVYNVERYLARCLDSVLEAVEKLKHGVEVEGRTIDCSVEIICVNDGSTDGSAEILEHYRSTFNLHPSTFSIITKPNGGQGSARNAGLDAMTGDCVTFVDSDDWILPQALAAFVSVAEASQAPLVVSTSFLKDTDGSAVRASGTDPHPPAWRLRRADWIAGKKVQYSVCNRLIRADLVRDRRFLPVKFEDFAFATELMCDVGSFATVDAPLYVYCSNGSSASTTRSPFGRAKLDDSFAVVRHVLDFARGGPSFSLALRQAADGLSSTIGKTYRTKDRQLGAMLLDRLGRLAADCPEVMRHLKIKARIRLRLLRMRCAGVKCDRIPSGGRSARS